MELPGALLDGLVLVLVVVEDELVDVVGAGPVVVSVGVGTDADGGVAVSDPPVAGGAAGGGAGTAEVRPVGVRGLVGCRLVVRAVGRVLAAVEVGAASVGTASVGTAAGVSAGLALVDGTTVIAAVAPEVGALVDVGTSAAAGRGSSPEAAGPPVTSRTAPAVAATLTATPAGIHRRRCRPASAPTARCEPVCGTARCDPVSLTRRCDPVVRTARCESVSSQGSRPRVSAAGWSATRACRRPGTGGTAGAAGAAECRPVRMDGGTGGSGRR